MGGKGDWKRKWLWGRELKNFGKCRFFESHRGHGGHRDLRVGSRMEGKMFTMKLMKGRKEI